MYRDMDRIVRHVSIYVSYRGHGVSLHPYLLGYSTGEFQALQLIVLAAFGAVAWPLAPCMLVHFLEI